MNPLTATPGAMIPPIPPKHLTSLPPLHTRLNLLFPTLPLTSKPPRPLLTITTSARSSSEWDRSNHISASSSEVDLFPGQNGVFTADRNQQQHRKVVVLWDLDNKPPRGPPYEAAVALRRVAGIFGRVVDISAYANRHAFLHLPQWVLEQRRDRRRLDALERAGAAVPPEPYVCGVCGRKCRTNLDLKKHFKQLHERERQKKINRMQSLKGKKRQKYKERFISSNTKYEEAARELLTPRVGYGLAAELRRAGVFVRTVADKPQAADAALKRQVHHSMTRGINCLILVSDDSDFCEVARKAKENDLRTVVVGDVRTALGRQADLWFPWSGVENGEVDEVLLKSGLVGGDGVESSFSFENVHSYQDAEWSELDEVVDEIVVGRARLGGVRISAFSEEEVVGMEDARDEEALDDDDFRIYGSSLSQDELLWDSEDEEDENF